MYALLSLLIIGLVLVLNEFRFRKRDVKIERSRKLAHILVGSLVAFWPFYLSWNTIRVLSLLFVLGVGLSKALNIFASIHEVERFTLGEICFALAVGSLSFVTKDSWLYAAAILQMSLADAMAALIGTRFGKQTTYKVLGASKSLIGSLVFFITSLAIILLMRVGGRLHLSIELALITALVATVVENLAVYGTDNLLLPLVTALMLAHG